MISLVTPTNKLSESIDFYSRLGYESISESPCVFTDGMVAVEIDPDRYARPGIKIYGANIDELMSRVGELAHITPTDYGCLFSDPSGVRIHALRKGPSYSFSPKEQSFGVLGHYSGLSLESTDMDKSLALYSALGFQKVAGDPSSGYVVMVNGDFGLSVMKPLSCPHLFFNPSMTYFNSGKNPEVIAKVREAGIPITEEITHFNKDGIVDNIIIRDPGGYGFFVFND